jgi:phosphatidylserine/phosphatidylglycerophosphate/cardiolipin synthase-like enzyme|tara:strand:+ start:3174 stop:3626 length:453 start_codon:yes stop_codon:yes gene_type:complete
VNYVSSYFSPNRGSADILIGFIDRCNVSIDAAVYSITHDRISDALVRAKDRGVNVRVITDKTQSYNRWSDDKKLEEANIPVLKLGRAWRGSMHNKFIIGDRKSLGTGSFNWTKNADKNNSENFVIIRLAYVVREFEKEFKNLWEERHEKS